MTTEATNDLEKLQRFLAELSDKLLPNPDLPIKGRWDVGDEQGNTWLVEALRKLDIRIDDFSPTAQTKLFDHLAKRMATSVLKGKDELEIKNRLGDRGLLRTDAYRISFDEYFDHLSPEVGVRPSH